MPNKPFLFLNPLVFKIAAVMTLFTLSSGFADEQASKEAFPLIQSGQPVAEIVIEDADANPDFSPWLLGAELHIPGNSAQGLGRPWVGDEIRSAEVHVWSRAGIPNTVEDVNKIIEQMTGTQLPVVTERTEGSHAIVFELVPAGIMDDDAFQISFPDPKTLQIRGSGRSIRWAFNHLLEEHAGVRWLFFDAFHYPRLTDFTIPMEAVEEMASYPIQRDPGYYRPEMLELYGGLNTKFPTFPRGGLHAILRDVFPVEKYAPDNSWPEAIMPVHGGEKLTLAPLEEGNEEMHQRIDFRAGWHPCFSNPATAEIAIENILEILAADPDRQIIGLGVIDRGGHCRCDECLSVVDDRTNGMGHPHYSDLYFAWANAVAEGVTEKYPHVYFELFAYRELFDPPAFEVHPHIIPYLTIDIHQTMDEEVGAEKWRQIANWSKVASKLGIYEYGWGVTSYALPRIYYQLHADFLKRFHEHGGVASQYGGWSRKGHEGEGPKGYLYHKLLWNIEGDPEEIITDWIRHAVGEEAAPYLREYFDFWEDYWTGDDIRRTIWYKDSVDSQYFRWREWTRNRPITHTFALEKGDMARLRELMEQVVAHTKTPEQRERAELLMLAFEYYEANARALLSELISPEGEIVDEGTAVEFIESIPAAFAARDRREQIIETLFDRPSPYVLEFDPSLSMLESFQGVAAHAKSPQVQSALNQLLEGDNLTDDQRKAVRHAWETGLATATSTLEGITADFAYRSTSNLVLDGKLDDAFWEDVPVHELSEAVELDAPEARTEFRVAFAEDGLYFAIYAEEPDADGPTVSERENQDNDIFQDDTIQVFLETPTHSFYQIAANAAGSVIDLEWSTGRNYDWSAGAQVATHIGEGYWSMEIRIPVDAVEEFDPDPLRGVIGARPTADEPWRFNITRTRQSTGEASSFSPLGSKSFIQPDRFVTLLPSPDTSPAPDVPVEAQD